MISAIERAERLIGTNGLRKLQDAGLVVGYHAEKESLNEKIIGVTEYHMDGQDHPVIDQDHEGYQILCFGEFGWKKKWVAKQNCGELR